ncbi:MAG: hypothetical protein ACYC0N_03005, partial [Carboxydocellales bacterium]
DKPIVKVDYFFNLLGKNDYEKFNKVYLLGTPRFDATRYFLDYYYYSEKKYDRRITLKMQRMKNSYGFSNKDVDRLRICQTAGELLQCAMRICRKTEDFTGEIHLFCRDEAVLELIKKQLPNIQVTQKSIEIENEEDIFKLPKGNKWWEKLILFIDGLPSGKYVKKGIRESINYKNKSDFSQKVLSHEKVNAYFKARGIINNNKYIIIP